MGQVAATTGLIRERRAMLGVASPGSVANQVAAPVVRRTEASVAYWTAGTARWIPGASSCEPLLFLRALVFAIACAVLAATSLAGCAGASDKVGAAADAACSYARSMDVGVGSGAEWLAISLARSGDDVGAAPLSQFKENMIRAVEQVDGKMDDRFSTAYSNTILALTAVGVDARSVAKGKLLKALEDEEFVEFQGINGPVWALIALDSHPAYAEYAEKTAPRLVKRILKAQRDDGGWAFSNSKTGDPDMTAMALTALASYDGTKLRREVDTATESGLAFLGEAQGADGYFEYEGIKSAESLAQAAVCLCSLGIDPGDDGGFVKEGVSLLDALLSFQDESGGFSHVKDEGVDIVASEQGCYALVAVKRMREGKSALFDMSDVELH